MIRWTIYKKRRGPYNHYSFFDHVAGVYMIACIMDKNARAIMADLKKRGESYELKKSGGPA